MKWHSLDIQFNIPFTPVTSVYVCRVCVGGGGVGDHACTAVYCNTLYDHIQNLQKCLTTPRQKPRRGGGLYV
jgi:hypothetical protein